MEKFLRIILCVGIVLGAQIPVFSQSVNAPFNRDYYHLLERLEIQQNHFSESFHTVTKPIMRKHIVEFLDSIAPEKLSRQDRFNREYLLNDSWEWHDDSASYYQKPVAKYFYKRKGDFFSVDEPAFDLHVNPVLYVSGGKDMQQDENLYINTRGAEVRGHIDKKVGFYTFLADNQILFPAHVNRFINKYDAVPNEGFWKDFKGGPATDFFTARGYISFQATQHINFQFGHDRFFIGNGYRSLILSDFSPSFLFLKIQTKIWKLQYTNIFGQLTADIKTSGNTLIGTGVSYPKKYIALHHLSYNISPKLNVGVFEAVISGDSTRQGIDINYLNPIIFYRSLEHQDGSSGNALVGLDARWIFAKHFSIYGQAVFDEFLLDQLRKHQGWWANKYALQGGVKYINAFGINNFDLQGEINIVRPYTYSHRSMYTNYANYRQPLAHPLGANFKEMLGILRWQPVNRLNVIIKGSYALAGMDSTGANFGGNILLDNNTRIKRPGDEGHFIGQGVEKKVKMVDVRLNYQWFHNFFIEAEAMYRKQDSEEPSLQLEEHYARFGIRWNIPLRDTFF